jgi:hypothetical protein
VASRRDAIVAAAKSALSAGSPSFTVERFRVLPVQPEVVPLMAVAPETETLQFVGHRMNNAVMRHLILVVSCWTKDGTSPDNALDDMVTWAVQKMIPLTAAGDIDETLGGTCHTIEEISTQWAAEVQDHIYSRADVRFRVGYQTKRTDPTSKVG